MLLTDKHQPRTKDHRGSIKNKRLTKGMFPHVLEAGGDEALPRDGVLLAGAAVVHHHAVASANVRI